MTDGMRHVGRIDPESKLPITEITASALRSLDEYSWTLPTSPSPGRMWKRLVAGGWMLGYCYAHAGDKCLLAWRWLVVVGDPA
jgi:hypothetical protein